MSYASQQDLIDRIGEGELAQLTDRVNLPEQVIGEDVVAAALADADRRIDAYIGVRYSLPLSATPPIVIGWAVSIARYILHRDGAPDYVVRDYRDAIAELKDASAGRLALPDAAGVKPVQTSDGGVLAEGSDPVFTAENLGGWL